MVLEYYKVTKKEKKKPVICPHNDACKCTTMDCERCGWNPKVDKRRKAAKL
jgi:hypothetical protein